MSRAQNIEMLEVVAKALGPKLCQQVAFVGGCTTALLITDEFRREEVRYTDDVDLVVHLTGYLEWRVLIEHLNGQGFRESMQDDINCRMRLGELKVDFMPDDATVLGYTNRWFHEGFTHAISHILPSGTPIRLFTPPYFLGTKLEAWLGRGQGDVLSSKDLEDILNLVDGREELLKEVADTSLQLRTYLQGALTTLLENGEFAYLVQGSARNNFEREQEIWQRLHQLAGTASA